MRPAVAKACKEHGGFYLGSIGGPAAVAKEALATGKTLREIVLARKLMDAATLDRVLDPRSMTKGGDGGRGE